MNKHDIKQTTQADVPALQVMLEQTGLFPAEMLPDMLAPALDGNTSDIWLTCHVAGNPVGVCFAVPETLAEGTWNMLALGVLPAQQGIGCGAALVCALEDRLRQDRQRLLIADTSGTDEFAPTREFYLQNGYTQEARICNFWAAGDDKVVFTKALS